MGNPLQYEVNIAIEATILVFLLLLFVTCVMRKKVFKSTYFFCYLLGFAVTMLVNQIVTWNFLINNVPFEYGAMPMRVVFALDFALYYGFSVAFFYYVESLIKYESANADSIYKTKKGIHKAMIIWGVIAFVVYVVLSLQPSIFRFENGVEEFSMVAYFAMHVMTLFACVCSIILIIRYRKSLGKSEAVLCLIFCTLVPVFSIVDELCGLCISYVLVSLFIFILYVRIDLHRELLLERQEKEIALWKTQIMLSQMQPHFLYNVLTTISSLCETQNALQARDVVNRFADYFRTNLDSLGNEKMISFEKELEHIKTYLWLEKVRFEDSLNIEYEIETINFSVPSLTVQPMVENAVKHGILPKEGTGTVIVKTTETRDSFVIIVEDDGVGFEPDAHFDDGQTHVGIENVSKRLEVICNGTCKIKSEVGKGTVVTISIPKGDVL